MAIGITERGDAGLDTDWFDWVRKGKPAILLSKNPCKLYDKIKQFDKPNVIAHATITGYAGTVLEPNVLSVEEAMKGVQCLKGLLGQERVTIRVDPVIPTEKGIETAVNVVRLAQEIGTFRIRVSFIDYYEHVKYRFQQEGISLPWETFHAPLEFRQRALLTIQGEAKTTVEICGEPDFKCTGCVSAKDCEILGQEFKHSFAHQRPKCACISLKTELLKHRDRCPHKCLYCFWKDQAR